MAVGFCYDPCREAELIRSLIFVVLAVVLMLSGATPAAACGGRVEILFFDSDGDIFAIRNKSEPKLALESLVIRLTGSYGRVFFDTDFGGLGANMPTEFAAVSDVAGGEVGFQGATPVDDGSEVVLLTFSKFLPGREFMFMVDVDDRLEDSEFGQAVVSGAEIEGAKAEAVLIMPGGHAAKAKGNFGDDGRALLKSGVCA